MPQPRLQKNLILPTPINHTKCGHSQLALQSTRLYDRSSIVIDKIIGLLVALFLLPVWFKLLIFTFILYHLVHLMFRFVQFRGIMSRLMPLPGALGVVADDIVAGLIVNLYVQLMLWIMH
jgi:phosphatidylglycerophosphatase A